MKRSFNYTQRKRIPESKLGFVVKKDENGRRTFDATIDLAELDFDEDAHVYVEAFYKRSLARFDFGSTTKLVAPADRSLEDVDFSDRIAFRVKVVDESGSVGRLLGLTDGIDLAIEEEKAAGRRSILPVSYSDELGSEVWRVTFTATGPILEVNNQIPRIRDIVRADKSFSSLVLPQAMRSVLERLIITEKMGLSDAGMGSWEGRWLFFAQGFSEEPLDSEANVEDRQDWVDNAVALFATHIDARGSFIAASQEED